MFLPDSTLENTSLTALLLEHPLPHWLVAGDSGKIVFANKAALQLSGFSEVQLRSLTFSDVLAEGHSALRQHTDRKPLHLRQHTGELVPVQVWAMPQRNEGFDGYLVTTVVCGQSQMQKVLNRYQSYVTHSMAGIFCVGFENPPPAADPQAVLQAIRTEGRFVECNRSMAQMYGFAEAEDFRNTLCARVIDFDDPVNRQFFQNFLDNDYTIENALTAEKDKDGHAVFFLNNATAVVENGRVQHIWGTQKDVTHIRAAEQKLERLAQMVEESSDILTAADLDFKPITWNKASEEIYGVRADEVIGRQVSEFLHIHYPNSSRSAVRRQILEEGVWRGELCFIRRRDQKLVTVLACFKLIRDDKGEPQFIITSGTDITERKEAEQRLRESENRFREVADSAPVMIWLTNEHDVCTYVNHQLLQFTGADVVFGSSGHWSSLVHPEDRERCETIAAAAKEQRQPFNLEYRLRTAAGGYRSIRSIGMPRFAGTKKFIGYIGSIIDVEEQSQRERQLRNQSMILEGIFDVVTVSDNEFRITSINKAGELAYEISADELLGRRLSEAVQFSFGNSSLKQCREDLLQKGYWEGEVSIFRKDGTVRYFLHKVKEFFDETGRRVGYLSVGREVTERRRMEEALQQSELFYKTLIADSTAVTLLVDREGIVTFVSPAIKPLLGFEAEEIVGRNGFEFVNFDDLQWATESFNREVEDNPLVKSITIRLKKKNGDSLWCNVRGHNMFHHPHINRMVVYLHDDTVRKQANDALKASEKRFRSLINDLSLGLLMLEADGTVVMANPMLCNMVGLAEEKLVGTKVQELLHLATVDEDDQPVIVEKLPLQHLLSAQPIKDFVVGTHHPFSQRKRWLMINSNPLVDDSGQLTQVICMIKDVTTRKEWEKKHFEDSIRHQRQLTQATIDGQENERREIGKELHDNIGQQLTSIKLLLEMRKNSGDASWDELMGLALKNVSEVIDEVRAMSRSLVPPTLKDLGLVESIYELVDTVMRSGALQIEVDCEGVEESLLPENLQLTLFRIVQEQLNNICKHAQATTARIQLTLSEGSLHLSITDDGSGFNPGTVRRGLGLANISNRAELFGGQASLLSEEGQGTLLRVTIPLG